jgi:maltose alpha-D-glucosyltransferase / alpha-amylase
MSDGWHSVIGGPEHHNLERLYLPKFLPRQRWFGAKNARVTRVEMRPIAMLESGEFLSLNVLEVALDSGETQQYFLPLSVSWDGDRDDLKRPVTLAHIRRGSRLGALIDAAHDEVFVRNLVNAIWRGQGMDTPAGRLHFMTRGTWQPIPHDAVVRSVGSEQTNASLVLDERIVIKIYRRSRAGVQPEIEIARFLSEVSYRNTPALLGMVEYHPTDGEPISLAALFAFVQNQGDCWNAIAGALDSAFEEISLLPRLAGSGKGVPYVFPADLAGRLGQRTAEMHRAFAINTTDSAFAREPITREDIAAWAANAGEEVHRGLLALERLSANFDDPTKAKMRFVQTSRPAIERRLAALATTPASGAKTRVHGDYHLGQVLISKNDLVIIDFEGEPARSISERRKKTSPLRDLAGMLRSFDYAAWSALERLATRSAELPQRAVDAAGAWRDRASRDFLEVYKTTAKGMASYPDDEASAKNQLEIFLIQKVFYEISYEAANRPTWLSIPLRGVLDLLSGGISQDMGEHCGD